MNSQLNNDNLKAVLNWSSGKDAAMAYYLLQQDKSYNISHLLTTVNSESDRIVMHGVRESLLDLQAESMQLPLVKVKFPAMPDDDEYKTAMTQAMCILEKEGVSIAAFGDIFLEDLRKYRERQLATIDIEAIFPLWKKNTHELIFPD